MLYGFDFHYLIHVTFFSHYSQRLLVIYFIPYTVSLPMQPCNFNCCCEIWDAVWIWLLLLDTYHPFFYLLFPAFSSFTSYPTLFLYLCNLVILIVVPVCYCVVAADSHNHTVGKNIEASKPRTTSFSLQPRLIRSVSNPQNQPLQLAHSIFQIHTPV